MIKNLTLFLWLLFTVYAASAQRKKIDRETDSLVKEGKALYRSEWASWYGTDIFLEKCAATRTLSGGYLSYETSEGLTNIFFTKGDAPMVMATISFAKDFDPKNFKLDTGLRKFDKLENDLFIIRTAALKHALSDTSFKRYKNTGINVIPMIQNGVKKVYILTSPETNGIILFGNDYLSYFDKNNEITSFKSLHKNLISVSLKADSGKTAESTMHTHLSSTSDFITATDICTLMLYEKFADWKQHYVISKNDISIWECKKNELLILTMEAWKRIGSDQGQKGNKAQKN